MDVVEKEERNNSLTRFGLKNVNIKTMDAVEKERNNFLNQIWIFQVLLYAEPHSRDLVLSLLICHFMDDIIQPVSGTN